jgi:hypothetical protein
VSKQDAGHKTTARLNSNLALEAVVVAPQARNATEQGETGGMDRNILERRAKRCSGPGTAKLFHFSCNSEARRFVINEHSEEKSRKGTFREGERFLTAFEMTAPKKLLKNDCFYPLANVLFLSSRPRGEISPLYDSPSSAMFCAVHHASLALAMAL